MNNKNIWIGLVVVAIIAIGSYQFPKVQTQIQNVLGAAPSPTHTEMQEFLGGVKYGLVNSTSSNNTTLTLVAGDIVSRVEGAAYDTIIMTPQVGTLALTLPASSTLAHFIPKTGQRAEQCWQNASSTAGINITFAAGTGIVLQNASTSVATLTPTIGPSSIGCFKFVRATSTASTFDIVAGFTRYVDAD